MTRSQRKWHLVVWSILAPLMVAGLAIALVNRPPAPKVILPIDGRNSR
jgi:hypothetical protein